MKLTSSRSHRQLHSLFCSYLYTTTQLPCAALRVSFVIINVFHFRKYIVRLPLFALVAQRAPWMEYVCLCQLFSILCSATLCKAENYFHVFFDTQWIQTSSLLSQGSDKVLMKKTDSKLNKEGFLSLSVQGEEKFIWELKKKQHRDSQVTQRKNRNFKTLLSPIDMDRQ